MVRVAPQVADRLPQPSSRQGGKNGRPGWAGDEFRWSDPKINGNSGGSPALARGAASLEQFELPPTGAWEETTANVHP